MIPTIYYCYDALCSWCYGFSPVLRQAEEKYRDRIVFDVLSGGMIMPDNAQPIEQLSEYVGKFYKTVEETTGVRFGEDYLWHIQNPDKSDWVLDSEKPAIALSIFKEYYPDRALQMASDIQYSLHYEGRDLTDDEAYRHLLERYRIDPDEFYQKLKSEEYVEKAYYDFALVRQLQVTGYPTVLMQVSDSKFYLLSRGYTDLETLTARIDKVLAELEGKEA